jgi:hypothetical protein
MKKLPYDQNPICEITLAGMCPAVIEYYRGNFPVNESYNEWLRSGEYSKILEAWWDGLTAEDQLEILHAEYVKQKHITHVDS